MEWGSAKSIRDQLFAINDLEKCFSSQIEKELTDIEDQIQRVLIEYKMHPYDKHSRLLNTIKENSDRLMFVIAERKGWRFLKRIVYLITGEKGYIEEITHWNTFAVYESLLTKQLNKLNQIDRQNQDNYK